MESLLTSLTKEESWQAFLQAKEQKQQMTKRELAGLRSFIEQKEYPSDPTQITFGLPEKKQIGRLGSAKKRTVYSYSPSETLLLKSLAWHLYAYDGCFSDGCYSFRQNRTAKTAIDRILAMPDRNQKYVLKTDIHNYFNSIDVLILLDDLARVLADDEPLYQMLRELLTQDACTVDGEVVCEKRGAMAGVPVSGFFANVYLRELDAQFCEPGKWAVSDAHDEASVEKPGGLPEDPLCRPGDDAHGPVVFFRYADDILILADSAKDRQRAYDLLLRIVEKKKLEINPDKTVLSDPGEPFEFLGFSFVDGEVDLSAASIRKMKDRIRRKAHRLWRKRTQKGLTWEKAAHALVRSLDNRLYDLSGTGAFTWTRYFFPVLTTDKGLHEIDTCMVQYLRYLADGRHHKKNYRIRYEDLRRLGYTSLVREYYNWREEERKMG